VSQVMEAEHLGLLLQGPILLPQIWFILLKVHCPGTPGMLQHGPPSQASFPLTIPSPQRVKTVMVPVKEAVTEVVSEMELVPEKDEDWVPVMVTVLVRDMDKEAVPVPVPVTVMVSVLDQEEETELDNDLVIELERVWLSVFDQEADTELERDWEVEMVSSVGV